MFGPIGSCLAACRRSSNSTSKFGYPVQLRYMGEPLCYAVAESGEFNTFTHVWVYESAGRPRSKSAPRWRRTRTGKYFLAENAKAGNVIEQKNSLMVPTAFSPPIPMPKIVK